MTAFGIAFLVVQGLVFLVWAFLAFRFLLKLDKDVREATRGRMRNIGDVLRAFRGGAVEARYAAERLLLIALTIALFALIGIGYFVLR